MSGGPVVVMAAMPRELRPIARALRMRPANLLGRPAWRRGGLLAVAVGVGPARSATRSAAVLDEVVPTRIFVTGVAGAVDPALEIGDLVVPVTVVDVRTGRAFSPDPGWASGPRSGLLATVERALASARVAGAVPSPPTTPAEGPTTPQELTPGLPEGTTAVDMETAAIAAEAEARGIPWDVVRGISDTWGMLTPELAAILRPDGRADLGAAARLVRADPRAVGRLVHLGLGTARATRAATGAVLAQLSAHGRRSSDN